ncbi:hypothetical protein FPHYL_2861 [Fusarium phyllophilum]|uniref:Uncharacterized protein n=1 Tax=Fusarium phyllophilum TaxID=47803 RepID=A0A8H5K9C3_9HYPO|nr:hypothetical protein FPHYL_2861 [Fusarium phyllophilum]
MDAKTTSDDGDEEIEILIEDSDSEYPRYVPDDPVEDARRAAYFEMLKKGTGEVSSMAEVKKTSNEGTQDNEVLVEHSDIFDEYSEFCTPRNEPFDDDPEEDDPSAVVSLHLDLATNNVPHFDLVTNSEPAFTVTSFPGVMTVEDTPPRKLTDFSSYVPSDHPGLLCLEFTSQSSIFAALHEGETPKPSAAGIPLPSVVLPIGQLRRRYKDTAGIPYSVDTEYVLVVDAVADEHSLWLIFDRCIRSHEEDGAYDEPNVVPLVFKGTQKNFDAAQVLPSIQDWIQSYGTLDLVQIRDSFQRTGITGEIRARNVTFADLPASWNRATSVDEYR